ncbi:hypothetical protein P171DRAFT_3783 [Karstenula rhodostoma CBS 690.94]|uniref:Uncharacterized protein n=1 Tax=Karstenula rhodostoma CBS 690.94 TaxID=1392251 RepID=A0A9P4PTZ6_9PLEO|nr:hypothetical protein P171DRAFT_3783 [Karstenula rhodostoma CBS 690.94]
MRVRREGCWGEGRHLQIRNKQRTKQAGYRTETQLSFNGTQGHRNHKAPYAHVETRRPTVELCSKRSQNTSLLHPHP